MLGIFQTTCMYLQTSWTLENRRSWKIWGFYPVHSIVKYIQKKVFLKTYLNNLTDKPKWNPGQFFFIYKIFLQFLVRSEDLQGGSPEGGREDEVTWPDGIYMWAASYDSQFRGNAGVSRSSEGEGPIWEMVVVRDQLLEE